MKYKELIIIASLSFRGGGYYEVAPIGIDGKRESSRKLYIRDCKEEGLVRRYDHTKKLYEFLNTEEGNQWFDENSRDFIW